MFKVLDPNLYSRRVAWKLKLTASAANQQVKFFLCRQKEKPGKVLQQILLTYCLLMININAQREYEDKESL